MNRNPKTLVLPESSNREDFYFPFGVFDDDTNEPIDMVALGWTFQFEIRRASPHGGGGGAIEPYYDNGFGPIIVLALGSGLNAVSILDVGAGLIWVAESDMRKLHHRTYRASLFANDGTRQFSVFRGTLPIDDGGVTN